MSSLPLPTTGNFGPASPSETGPFFRSVGEVVEGIVPGLRESVERVTALEKAWVDLLKGHDWRWFGTFTYRDSIHPEAADKQFRLWARRLDETNGVQQRKPRDCSRRCTWVRGLEWQKRGVLHYHALIGNVPAFAGQNQRDLAVLEWLTISGGFARIDQISSVDGAIAYVSKYTRKGGEVDFSPNLQRLDLLSGMTSAA